VLEVSFWHPELAEWLVPPSARLRREMILGASSPLGVEIRYNSVWNRGEIVSSRALAADFTGPHVEVFVSYDRTQVNLQCSDEWLMLDCELMHWGQGGFGWGSVRLAMNV
jgi:hypothetical protein